MTRVRPFAAWAFSSEPLIFTLRVPLEALTIQLRPRRTFLPFSSSNPFVTPYQTFNVFTVIVLFCNWLSNTFITATPIKKEGSPRGNERGGSKQVSSYAERVCGNGSAFKALRSPGTRRFPPFIWTTASPDKCPLEWSPPMQIFEVTSVPGYG